MGIEQIRDIKNRAYSGIKEKKEYKPIKKVSDKRRVQLEQTTAELDLWFTSRRNEMINECMCGCGSKTNKDSDRWYKHSIAHIFAKRKTMFPSISTHELNYVELSSFNGCHNQFDSANGYEWAKTKPILWNTIITRAKELYKSMTEQEKNKVPDIILKEI